LLRQVCFTAQVCYFPAVSRRSPLLRFLALYAGMFTAFGVAAPFLPGLFLQDGLGSGAIGVVLASGTAIRLIAGPVGGRLADRTGRPVLVLSGFTAAASVIALGYAPARGLPLLLLISVAHASVLAPMTRSQTHSRSAPHRIGRGFSTVGCVLPDLPRSLPERWYQAGWWSGMDLASSCG
jgi:MFS transporter, PPP family, 3-phenylpropionic acid transporter